MLSSPSPAVPDLAIRRAKLSDLQRIVLLEHECFAAPWSPWMIRLELTSEECVWLVAELGGDVVGYVGLRLSAGEGHISTLAVAREVRGQGLGEALMLVALDLAARAGVDCVVLEYRVSNEAAARLYAKLGFEMTRLRRGYYQDNGEDAIEVILRGMNTPARRQALASLSADWEVEHGRRVPELR